MITLKYTGTVPQWSDVSHYVSVSKLLSRMSDKELWSTEVYFYDRTVYVILMNKDGSVSFKHLPKHQWQIVYHIVTTNPVQCDCVYCRWRMKRRQYALSSFVHVWSYER